MKIEIDLMEELLQAVDAEAERVAWNRDQVINHAVLQYFSEPISEVDEQKILDEIELTQDVLQIFKEIAERAGLTRDEVVERILGAYLTGWPKT